MRWLVSALVWVLVAALGFAEQGWEEALSSHLLRKEFCEACALGEVYIARYKDSSPPFLLYYYLFLSYANCPGEKNRMRAEDIKRILEQELSYAFPVPRKMGTKPDLERNSRVTYQVGAFKERRNAENLIRRLTGVGLTPYLVWDQRSRLYKVRVDCDSFETCQTLTRELKNLGISFRKLR